jgi:hypothetical protein
MATPEVPSNSRNPKPEKKQPVVNYQSLPKNGEEVAKADREPVGQIAAGKTRKRPLGSKIAEAFTGDDAKTVGHYVFYDVALPMLQELVVKSGQEALSRLIFGSSRLPSTTTRSGFVNYQALSQKSSSSVVGRAAEPDGPRGLSNQSRALMNYDEIVLASRADAEQVLFALRDRIERYDVTTLSDLLEMIGVSPDFTDHKIGWFDLSRAAVTGPIRGGGYLLNLPKAEAIQ